jgi:RNA polymerase sigma-70 factor (ECF subfamily)
VNGPGDDPLLLSLAAGDERAFAVLYDRFADRMYRTALRLLGRREDAEDVVQDVFLAAVRSRDRLAEARDLTAYLFAALHRAAGRCAMRRAKTPETSSTAPDEAVAPAERDASENPHWQRLQRALQSLPDEQREVITLKIDGELTFAQIGEVMGVSLSTAASRYQYALRKLRNVLIDAKAAEEAAAGRNSAVIHGERPTIQIAAEDSGRWRPA